MATLLLALTSLLVPDALAARNRCGDGVVRSGEQCDGASLNGGTCSSLGFTGGTLACSSTCTYNTSGCTTGPVCGDGVAEGAEACDGADLGGETCETLGWAGGSLGCTAACTLAEGACSDGLVCGDGVTGGYEECDVGDDGACPGDCSAACACPATTATGLEVHVLDVGQGDAILLVSPDGYTMLLDGGPAGSAPVVQAYLASVGVTSLDYVAVSHLHADHLGGMDGVLAAYPEVVAAYDNGGASTTAEYLAYDSAAGDRRVTLTTGDSLDLGASVVVDVLHANAGSANENDNSVVFRVTYGNHAFLLGGDCEEACEGALDPGRIEVYKVHHHGAANASTDTLLAEMDPWTAIVSVGAANAYGHPTAGALARLADAQATVYRTDLDGDVPVYATPTSYTVDGEPVCVAGDVRLCGASDVGACALGWYECGAAGVWDESVCVGEVTAIAEVCDNGLDDDCDGLVDTADPACPAEDVRLAQVAYDTPGTDTVEEYVDLYNAGAASADVSGWRLADNGGTFTLPAGTTIPAGGYLTVARSAAGLFAWTGLSPDVAGMSLSFANTGDWLRLDDASGAEVDFVAWEGAYAGWTGAAGTGSSLYRTPVTTDTDTAADWATAASMPLGGF